MTHVRTVGGIPGPGPIPCGPPIIGPVPLMPGSPTPSLMPGGPKFESNYELWSPKM